MMTCIGVLNTQNLSLKVMLKSKWLSLVLNVDFMTLTILKLDFFSIFLESIVFLKAMSQNLVEKPSINVILSYFRHLDSRLLNITYLHITCTVF